MTKIHEAAVLIPAPLPSAAWDLTSFLENARAQIQLWGGLVLMLLGAVGLVWGGVLLIRKLIASPQTAGQQSSWGTVALLILCGGALGTGGWQFIETVGSGGQQTIEDLGGGTIIVQTVADGAAVRDDLYGGQARTGSGPT
ncbi:hypothetical protein C8K30_1011003 [Promicromonospora sp. AC04]|uniref:hypothetical protein n=1 Tax=Promicromonospora sp. AC04 TaxID=2135723 RepID=UPI000D4411DD|nr:hypothetical protein [Promicromonospora sp. AC04]PUB32477.1 hypothetical protein C8K30_1011003 [Promicromonospora sp. AC04]